MITKVKALEKKYQSTERSIAAPPALHHQTPIIQYQLSGQNNHVAPLEPEYHIVTFEEPGNLTNSSSEQICHLQAQTHEQNLEPGPSNQPRLLSKKRKRNVALDDIQPQKTSKRTCQKCGNKDCAGSSKRKFCKQACQDCGKMECRGRNSQHPKKTCAVGWNLYYKELK